MMGHQPEKEVSLMAWVKDHEGKLIQCKSVIDTGNTLYSTGAISEKFHKKLQVGFKKKRIRTVGTAKKGAAMTDLGVSKAIEVRFEGIQQRYLLNPRVIRELHTDLNLSNLFLKKVKAKMDFSMDRTVLTIGNENTELIQELGVEREKNEKAEGREPKTALVHCLRARKEVLVKANTLTFVKIRPQKGMIQVSPIKDATCQAINALYEYTERVAILSLGEEHRHLSAGDVVCIFKHEGERVTEIQTDVQSVKHK